MTPSGLVITRSPVVPPEATATHRPFPYATERQSLASAAARAVQVSPSARAGVAGPATAASTRRPTMTVDANRRRSALMLATTLRNWPRKVDFDMPGSPGLPSGARCATQGPDERPEDSLNISRSQAARCRSRNRRTRMF